MVEQATTRAEQVVQVREVLAELRQADVLEHADGADRVEATVDVAVVLDAELDTVDPGRGRRAARVRRLVLRQRDADRLDAVMPRRVHHHAAPPTPDVEESHARPQPELAADEVVLRGLGLFERGGLVWPHRARVGHRRSEDEPVEVVRDVVVVRDGGGVTRACVPPAVQPRLLGRHRWPVEERAADESREREPLCGSQAHFREPFAQFERLEDVAFEIELTGDVRAREAELARCREDVAQRVG